MQEMSGRTERAAVAFTLVAPAAIVLAHTFAAIFGSALDARVDASAQRVSYAAIAVAVAAAIVEIRRSRWTGRRPWAAVIAIAIVGGAIAALAGGELAAAGAIVPAFAVVGAATLALLRAVAARIPDLSIADAARASDPSLPGLSRTPFPSPPGAARPSGAMVDPNGPGGTSSRTWLGSLARRPAVVCAWAALSIFAIAETARVSAFMANHEMPGAVDSMLQRVAEHDCMGGYVYAGELSRRGHPNVYDTSLYPLGTPNVQVRPEAGIPASATTVEHLAPFVLDNLQYPPPFLLVPRAGLALTNDYLVMRTTWFAIQWLALAAVTFAIAVWIGGRTGATMTLLLPLFLVSGPTSLGLQRGQFHPAAWALALFAMLAFEKRKDAVGGAMLAFAVLSKIFPGVLGIYLIATKRWRAVGWTLVAGAAWIGVSLIVVGPATFERFVVYQLPRIASGDAFAWCFERQTCITNNQAPYGLPFKLSALGWIGDPSAAGHAIAQIYPWVVVVLAIWAGLRTQRSDGAHRVGRAARARAWTSVAVLASLTPNLVPAAYGPLAGFWTLMLLAGSVRSRTGALLVAIAWIAAFQIPSVPTSDAKMALSFVTAIILLGVNVWTALGLRAPSESTSDEPALDSPSPNPTHAAS